MAVSGVKNQAQSREIIAKQEALRKRAARQAAAVLAEPKADQNVVCTVLPFGADKISMGEHVGGLGEVHYEEGETFSVPLPIAQELKDKGYVNFKAPAASPDA